MLPFLHPPTFLNRLRASASNPQHSSGSSPPAPEKPHSPLLLLGMLALTSRYIPSLVQHHAPALTTPLAVSEFYASALKHRLQHDDESEFLVPTLEKVQALLMLSVHEWGQNRKSEAYMWLGLAIRMAANLELPWVDDETTEQSDVAAAAASPDSATDDGSAPINNKRRKLDNGTAVKTSTANAVAKEVRRRTFWAVFILDRALSGGRAYPSGVSSADASRVQLPCEDRGFMFGTCQKHGTLNSAALLSTDEATNTREPGDEERILAHIVKSFEIYGAIQAWASSSSSPDETTRHNLSSALDRFVDQLPPQLEFSLQTLQIHTSTQTAPSYATLHTTIFLSRLTLDRCLLPGSPLTATHRPQTARLHAAARDLITLIAGLDDWSTPLENPFFLTAVHAAANLGLYAYHFPWLDPSGFLTACTPSDSQVAAGTGEEPRKALDFITRTKPRFGLSRRVHADLIQQHTAWSQLTEEFIQTNPAAKGVMEQRTNIIVNHDERQRLFAALAAPGPKKPSHPPQQQQQIHYREDNNHVNTLLAAAEGKTAAAAADPKERWMAVNTMQKETGFLDTLAGFAAQQGKMEEGGAGAGGSANGEDEAGVNGRVAKKEEEEEQEQEDGWMDDASNAVVAGVPVVAAGQTGGSGGGGGTWCSVGTGGEVS